MSVNLKESWSYIFKNEKWFFTFEIIAGLTLILNFASIFQNNTWIILLYLFLNLGYSTYLINHLLQGDNQGIADFNIKKMIIPALKYQASIFFWLLIFIGILIFSYLSISMYIVSFGLLFALIPEKGNFVPYFLSLMSIPLIFLVITNVIYYIFSSISPFLFSENFSILESLNIIKIYKVFISRWKQYVAVIGIFILSLIPSYTLYQIAPIYDNKPALILFIFVQSIIQTFIFFIWSNLFTQVYKQSLAKINNDTERFESLKAKLNVKEKVILSLIPVILIALNAMCFQLPLSQQSPFGQMKADFEKFIQLLKEPKLIPAESKAISYEVKRLSSCNITRYELKNPTLFPILRNNKIGYIDKTGKLVIYPKFDSGRHFNEGLAVVGFGEGIEDVERSPFQDYLIKGKYGYTDTNGNLVINPIFDNAGDFKEGLAAVKAGNKYGYIDKTGKYAIPSIFDSANGFKNGFAKVTINKRVRTINKVGDFVTEEEIAKNSTGLTRFEKNGKYGFVNNKNRVKIKPVYDNAFEFSEGLAIVEKKGKNGAINEKGKVVIDLKYDYLSPFQEGVAIVVENDKYGFIDKTGKIIVTPKYKDACNFSEGMADVNLNNKIGYIDKTGKEAIPLQYEGNYGFKGDIAPVLVGGKWGYINKKGNYVWKPTN